MTKVYVTGLNIVAGNSPDWAWGFFTGSLVVDSVVTVLSGNGGNELFIVEPSDQKDDIKQKIKAAARNSYGVTNADIVFCLF